MPVVSVCLSPGVQRSVSLPALTLGDLTGRTLAEIERIVIEDALIRHGDSVPRAARELDVSASTLYRKREAWEKAKRPE